MRAVRQAVSLSVVLMVAMSVSLAAQADTRAAIDAVNRKFQAAAAQGNAMEVTGLYTADAQLMPSNSETITGTAAIGDFWSEALGQGLALTLESTEVEGHGDVAHEVGTYEMKDAGGRLLDRGKYVVIWKRVNGDWKLHRDIWNTSLPAAGHVTR